MTNNDLANQTFTFTETPHPEGFAETLRPEGNVDTTTYEFDDSDIPMRFAMKAYELHAEQRDEEALRLLDAALKLEPEFAGALFLKGIIALSHGDFKTGWSLYEYRNNKINSTKWDVKCKDRMQWKGKPTTQRLYLWTEQGHGDTIQMLRYVPYVRMICPNIILEVQPALIEICEGLAPIIVGDSKHNQPYDVHCSLMSLPYMFRNTNVPIPDEPYINIPKILHKPSQGYGIFWNSRNAMRQQEFKERNIPFKALGVLDEFDFISLQPEDTGFETFYKTALLMNELELIITTDSAIAHLAGAMGRPVWILLSKNCDWRWQQNRKDSPWYPTARLFRQETQGEWIPVMEEVANNLRNFKS